jgi:hypothetical protein
VVTIGVSIVGRVFFPLDEQLQLQGGWSEGVVKRAVWLSGQVSFERAAEIMAHVGRVDISVSSVWRQTQALGEGFRQVQEAERARANVVAGPRVRPAGVGGGAQRLGVGLDGGMIHIRGEGWKEVKVGCVFEVRERPTLDVRTGDTVELAHAVNNSYVAHLGGPEPFGELLWAEAQRRGWEQATATEVVGDGAPWVWNLTATHFYSSRQVVDWFHATEHLAQAAGCLHGEGSGDAKRFFNTWETPLFQGHALRLAEKLQALADSHPQVADKLRTEAGYFVNNYRRMNYLEMRTDGWLIGSGMIESGCKQTKARFAGPGMRWSRPGAERLLPVRMAIMSERFDELWPRIYNSPPN